MIERSAPMSRVERFGLIAGLVLAVALMWPLREHVTDQMFVHLQHARNLSEGRGLVFNPGERIYATSSPLWVALIADAMYFGADGQVFARLLGALATLASIGFFFQLVRRTVRSPEVRALATLAWATHPWLIEWSVSGREAPLAVALVLAGFVAFTEGESWGSRPVRTGALWALAALTRPEAVLLVVLWGALAIVDAHNRTGVRRMAFGAVTAGIVYGGWLLFARVYYGTFWPQLLSARHLLSPSPDARWPNLIHQIRLLMASDLTAILVLLAALVFGARAWWAHRSQNPVFQAALPWLWIVLLPALYVARGVMASTRHVLLVAPVLDWMAWRAAAAWWLGPDPSIAHTRRAVLFSALFTVAVLVRHGTTYATDVVPRVHESSAKFERTLVHWGRWFGEHAPAGSVIAAPDVGAIGYLSRHPVLDTSGRVTPDGAGTGIEELEEWLRRPGRRRPDFLVHEGASPYALRSTSFGRSCLVPIGETDLVSVYRIDWDACERAALAGEEPAGPRE